MATITKIKWDDADFKWNTAPPSEDYKPGFKPSTFPYTWDDVSLVEELLKGPPGELWDEWDAEKKKRIIKLICKVQGRTYKETKEIKDIKILAEKVLGIEVLTENIKF